MFPEVFVLNEDNSIAINPSNGFQVRRRCMRFIPDGDNSSIYVYYKQFEVGLDNSIVNAQEKSYYIKNIPAVNYTTGSIITPPTYYEANEVIVPAHPAIGNEVKTPATYYLQGELMENNEIATGGELKTPAVLYGIGEIIPAIIAIGGELKSGVVISNGTEVNIPAVNAFDNWKNYQISSQMVGLTFEQFFVEMQINPRLRRLPVNVESDYNNN